MTRCHNISLPENPAKAAASSKTPMKEAGLLLNRGMWKDPSPHLRLPCLSILTLIGGRLPAHGSGVICAGLPSPFQSPKAGKAPLKTAVCAQTWQGQPHGFLGFRASLFPAVFCLKGEPAAQPCVLVRRRALKETVKFARQIGLLPFLCHRSEKQRYYDEGAPRSHPSTKRTQRNPFRSLTFPLAGKKMELL